MSDYGLTSNGPNIKRLDVILDEMQEYLIDKTGMNVKQNTESLLNVLLTDVADKIAELWEVAEDVYYSQYPSSAEGSSLDSALQFAGITREQPAKSYYPILCIGLDGTTIPSGTQLATDTNPTTYLTLSNAATIERLAFNQVVIIMAEVSTSSTLTASINGTVYSASTLEALAEAITDEAFTVTYDSEAESITIIAVDDTSSNALILSSNLTTSTVGTVITFETEEYGDIVIPNGVVTKIVKAVAGLQSVTNVGTYVAGRELETDTEARQSYLDKIYNRASSMIESIRSAILDNVQGVETCAVFENDTDEYDNYGRPPHSVEVVVDGGDKTEIAQQILNTKAAGINTYCTDDDYGVSVTLTGTNGEDIVIRFNRPADVYVWFQVGITLSSSTNPPTNYAELIQEAIVNAIDALDAGEDVLAQDFISTLYSTVSGIDYYNILMYSTSDSSVSPTSYTDRSIAISDRQRATTTAERISVVIDG